MPRLFVKYIYPALLPPVLFPIIGRRAELHDRAGYRQDAGAGRLKSVRHRRILHLSRLIRAALDAVGRHQRVARWTGA